MRYSSRSRRFAPGLDRLDSRLLLSTAVEVNPMDPTLIDWENPTPPTPPQDVNPMDPTLIGFDPDNSGI